MHAESMSQWNVQRRLSISGLVCSYPIWCLGTGTHVDAQGQKAPFLFKEREPDPDAQQGAALGFVLLALFPFFVGLVLGLFTKMYFV